MRVSDKPVLDNSGVTICTFTYMRVKALGCPVAVEHVNFRWAVYDVHNN